MNPQGICPPHIEAAMDMLGKKWTGLILRSLVGGPKRFTEIASCVPGLSDRLLSQRLQELEETGIAQRQVYSERPVRVEYSLTDKGLDLKSVLQAIQEWAERWQRVADRAH